MRHLWIKIGCFITMFCIAKNNNTTPNYEKTQFWLGLKGGMNLSHTAILERFTVLESTTSKDDVYKKEYQNFNQIGSQFQFCFQFAYRSISLMVAPGYKSMGYNYKNKYNWTDADNASNKFELNYNQIQTLEYAILPITLKYEFLKKSFKPYVQAGIMLAMGIKASKTLQINGTDNASGGTTNFEKPAITSDASMLYNPLWTAAIGGLGLNYDKLNIRLFIEINYMLGLNNITNANTRYTVNQFAGSGDVLDNVKISNIDISIGALFPLKFLDRGAFIPVHPH